MARCCRYCISMATRFPTRPSSPAANAAMISANAGKFSADAAVGIELPILRAFPSDLLSVDQPIPENGAYGGGVNDSIPTKYSAIGYINYKNYGRTPAFPIDFSGGWEVTAQLPDNPDYTKCVGINHAVVYRPASEDPETNYSVGFHCTIELTDQEIIEISNGTSWLWFYGCLKFRDFMNTEQESRFCWRWANRNHDGSPFYFFASDGNPPPAYLRAPKDNI